MDLETKRLIVRDFTPADAQDLYEILGDEEVMRCSEPAYDLEKTRAFLHSFCIGRRGAVAAALKDGGKVIGYLLFNELTPGLFEMGWFFGRRFWRQGYAYEACSAVIDDAFDRRKAHKIFAETTDPVKSAGLMQKLGMRPEGVQRGQTRDERGNWTDLYLYGLLREDRNI